MAGTQFSATVVAAELTLAFETQYVSGGLNQKLMALPRGIVRGFRPVPTVNNDEIELQLDTMMLDSMMNAVGIAPGNAYVVTYRTVLEPVLDLSAEAAARYYVAFVPNYTIGAATDGQWRFYTEAEFEAGDIATDGGVFACSLLTTGNVGVIEPYNIFLAGQSTVTDKLFLREDVDNFKSDQGPSEKALVVDWLPNPQFDGLDGEPAGYAFDDSTIHNGGGSLSIVFDPTTSAQGLADVHPVWRDGTTQDAQATVVVQYWFSTDGSYATTADAKVDVVFRDAANTTRLASAEFAAGRAPTYREIPTATGTPWTMIRYEAKVPDGVPIDTTSFSLEIDTSITAGTLYLGRIQAWLIHRPSSEPGDFSRSFRPVIHRGGRHEKLLLRSFLAGSADRIQWQIDPNESIGPTSLLISPVDNTESNRVVFGVGAGGGANSQIRLQGSGTSSSWLELQDADLRTDTIRGESSEIVSVLQQTTGVNSGILKVSNIRGTASVHAMQTSAGSYTGHILNVGSLTVQDVGIVLPVAGNEEDVGGTPVAHTLYESAVTKGYGTVRCNTATLSGTFGVASASVNATRVLITLKDDMSGPNYPVFTTTNDTGFEFAIRDAIAGSFEIRVYDTSTGNQVDADTAVVDCIFMWVGEQA